MIIRNWYEGDCYLIQRRDGDDWFHADTSENAARYGRAFTFEENDIPVAVMGIYMGDNGKAQTWAIISDYMRGKGLHLTRHAKRLLNMMEMVYGPSECLVRANSKEYQRWAELLGFKKIGRAEDKCLYSR